MPTEHPTPPTLTTLHLSPSSTNIPSKPSKQSHTTANPPSIPQLHQTTSSMTQLPNPRRSNRRKKTPKEHLGPLKEWQLDQITTLIPDNEEESPFPTPPPPPSPTRHPSPSMWHVPLGGNASTSTNTSTNNPTAPKPNNKNKIKGKQTRSRKYPTISDLALIRQRKKHSVEIRDLGSEAAGEEIERKVSGGGSGSEGDISGEGEDEKREDVECDEEDKDRRDKDRQEERDDEGSGGERDGDEGEKGSAKGDGQAKYSNVVENKDESMEDQESEGFEKSRGFNTGTDCCKDTGGGETKEVETICEERRNLTKRRRIG